MLAHLDRASRLTDLLESQPTLDPILAGIAIAFGVGALHALAPGHVLSVFSGLTDSS